jgi:hypothetical protein
VIDDEYGAVGGMRIGRGTEEIGENLLQHYFVHHKSHVILTGLEHGSPRWEAGD